MEMMHRVVDQKIVSNESTTELEATIEKLVEIAKVTPVIKRMWVFGSRHKGNHRACSDLDLAVEVEWVPNQKLGFCNDSFSLWFAASKHFEQNMRDVCAWVLDLQMYAGEKETPRIHDYLQESSKLIYKKI